ncbi:TetR/AcrR family transcriptional regulator [Kineococcus arenarius]|uniref:TetR/AcrR family transcriptional regulator n=1 Tax=Kineococcus sp. SYSU DK007 TaxID=3383128 RepID=UPI003D7DA639
MAVRRGDRRADIVAAAHRCIAQFGYERATTARICAAAQVSSGTFFHYFPTKVAVLVAVLQSGVDRTREVFERIRATAADDALTALGQWREHVLAEAADEDLARFAEALSAVPDAAEVVAVLEDEKAVVRRALVDVLAAGQRQGTVRTDIAAERAAQWLSIVAEAVLGHAVEEGGLPQVFASELEDVVTRVLRP